MSNNRIEVIALKDNDICLKNEKVFMKRGIFVEYHQNNFAEVKAIGDKTEPKKKKTKKDEGVVGSVKKMFGFGINNK